MGERLKNSALAVGSVLLSLLLFSGCFEVYERTRYAAWRRERAAELGPKSLVVPSTDPSLIWENRSSGVWGGVTINRWGFRDVDRPAKEKPRDAYRIAFVGDSVTFGGSTKDDALFVSLVGRRAAGLDGARHVQAMNFSVGGYNTLQVAELVRSKVLEFSPDEVIYVLCLNDFDFDDASGQLIRYFRPPTSFAWERLTRARVDPAITAYHEHYFAKNHADVFAAIRDMARLLAERHVDLQVVVMPVFDFSLKSFRDYPLSDIHRELARFFKENGISDVDLLPSFRDCSAAPPSLYATDVWHLNDLGHRFVAQALFEPVLSRYPHTPDPVPERLCAALRELASDGNAVDRRALAAALANGQDARLPVGSSLVSLRQFWPVERGAHGPYAWTQGRSVLRISGLRPGSGYHVRLEIADAAGRSTVSVGPPDGALETITIAGMDVDVRSSLAASELGTLELELRNETWRPSSNGATDTRDLGVALGAVVIRAEGATRAPASPN